MHNLGAEDSIKLRIWYINALSKDQYKHKDTERTRQTKRGRQRCEDNAQTSKRPWNLNADLLSSR